MKEKLYGILNEAQKLVQSTEDLKELNELKVKYFGKKGDLTAIMKDMGRLSDEEKPLIGQIANDVRTKISGFIDGKIEVIRRKEM